MNTLAVLIAASALVAGEPWLAAPPPSHLPPKVMGRDYWTFFHEWRYSHPLNELEGAWDNSAVANLPMFRDCGLVYYSGNLSLPPGKGTWRKVIGNFGGENGVWRRFESTAKTNCPATMLFHPKCRYTPAMAGEIDLDYDDYAAWKARHPNLVSVRFQSEWGVDLVQRMLNRKREKDPAARAVLEEAWNRWSWTNRYDRLEQARWYMERHIDLNYGDLPMFESFRSANFLDHMAAARGASTLVSETTNTSDWNSEYRWDVSSMFIRGAARQFGGLPWHWFVAGFFNGPCKDGTWANDSHCSAGSRFGLAGGTSDSLERRVAYFAYLNGAGAVEPESWQSNFFASNSVSGKMELTARGRNFSDFHDFTAAHPGRGATYAPVAVLVPIAQGYHTCGGKAWGFCPYTTPDHMVDAIFFTIAPGFDRRKVLAEGWERNLHNSPFALMYDVLVPDTQQPQKDFHAALRRYPVAILSGRYRPEDYAKFAQSLSEYVRGGGTLVVNAAHVRDGMFASLAGLVSPTETFRCASTAVDDEGATFQVADDYDCAELSPRAGDCVLVKDGEGRPLVVASCIGKGRVVTMAPLWLVPQVGEKGGEGAVHLTRTGRRRFPFVENLLSRLQRELFPVAVEGGAQFGLNRTADGWWLWCFNNHGVRKFADAPQEIDHAQDSRLRIDVSRLGAVSCRELISGKAVAAPGGKFGWTLPAGELAVFELRRSGATAPDFKLAARLRGEKEDVVFTSCSGCFQNNL